jgi:hypothetical protein
LIECFSNIFNVFLIHYKDDNEVEVNFLEKSGKYGKEYKWPTRPDKIWIPKTDILTVLQEPRPVGKTKRMYQMDQRDYFNFFLE